MNVFVYWFVIGLSVMHKQRLKPIFIRNLNTFFLLPCKHCNSFSICKCSCRFSLVFMLFASCVHLHAVTTGFLWTTFQHTLHFASLCRYKSLLHCQPMHDERDIFCNNFFFFVKYFCCINPKSRDVKYLSKCNELLYLSIFSDTL